jgi:hypothetical protein
VNEPDDLTTRVAAQLADLLDEHGVQEPRGVRITVPVDAEGLAAATGDDPAEVARVLRELDDAGVVKAAPNAVLVRDRQALARQARR